MDGAAMVKRSKGRPTLEEGSSETKLTRVNEDIAEMASWIVRVEGGTSAQLLDPLLRPALTAKMREYKPIIDKIKAAESLVRKAEEEGKAKARSTTSKSKGKPIDPAELYEKAKNLPVL